MDAVPRILMMGGRRCAALPHCPRSLGRNSAVRLCPCIARWCCSAGKSSIQRVVFHKMSPHETLFLTGTNALDIKLVANNPFVQFQIWDLPGDFDVNSSGAVCACMSTCGRCGSRWHGARRAVVRGREADHGHDLQQLQLRGVCD